MRKNDYYPDMDDQKTEDFIWEKMTEAADAYEEELNADPTLDDVCLTQDMMDDMMRRIAEEDEKNAASENLPDAEKYLSEYDRETLEIGRKERARREKRSRNRKILLRAGGVAAVLATIFGLSMTIEANRIKFLNALNVMQGKEAVIRVENDEKMGEYDANINTACADILEKTGIHAIKFMYIPKEMQFTNYVVNDASKFALMFYKYNDTILTVDMEKKSEQLKKTQIFDGEVLENFEIETDFGAASAMEIEAPEGEKDYVAQITYDNCQYSIYGVLPRDEFVKMIELMYFY